MLAFSNDYYGMIFRATQSVELFCAYYFSTLLVILCNNFTFVYKHTASHISILIHLHMKKATDSIANTMKTAVFQLNYDILLTR